MSNGIEVLGGLGLSNKSNPLISFHTIIDEDMSLVKYILIEFRNPTIFDLEKVKSMSYLEILGELYRRKYKNPLYFLMKDNKDKDFLDQCYAEFLSEHEKDILNYNVSTEIFNLVMEFKSSGDINPNILYYTKEQKELLDSFPEFDSIPKISIDDIKSRSISRDSFTQFYFKTLDEYKLFSKLDNKTYYFSTMGLNLTEKNDDIFDNDLVLEIINSRSTINLFDIYQMDYIGRYDNNDE